MPQLPALETLISALHGCRQTKELPYVKQLFAYLFVQHLDTHPILGNHLVPTLVDCGCVPDAQRVLSRLAQRNEHSWTSLISGYIDCGESQQVFSLYHLMRQDAVLPSAYTLQELLRACASLKESELGHGVHTNIIVLGLERDSFIGNTLVDMYGKCGLLVEALHAFDALANKDIVSWNALIGAYAEHGMGEKALECLKQMELQGVSPAAVTFPLILKACCMMGGLPMGQMLHIELIRRGLENDVIVANALVDMYGRFKSHAEAQSVFSKLPAQDAVSWYALIAGFADNGHMHAAWKCFKQMQMQGGPLVPETLALGLKACGLVRALETSQEIHSEVTRRALETDVCVSTALVDMYVKCNSLLEARYVSNRLQSRDSVLWAALISGYSEHGFDGEVLNCFVQMQFEGVSPAASTFACCSKACAALGAPESGLQIHNEVIKRGLERDLCVGNGLVDMYGKCGFLVEAQGVFYKLPVRDVASWTAMIKGYGENQKANLALECFEDMSKKGVKPNAITFLCLLAACSQANLIGKGQELFKMMVEKHNIEPMFDHCSCMVDLLARSGLVGEAERFAKAVGFFSSQEILRTLLTACKRLGEVEVAIRCFQQLVHLDQGNAAAYVLMEDIYVAAGLWADASRIEEMMIQAGLDKKIASASIELNSNVHE